MLAPVLALTLVLAQLDDPLVGADAAALGTGTADKATLLHMVDQTLPKVSHVMGVSAPRKVTTQVITREEASLKLLQILEREYPGDKLQRLQMLLQLVRLLAPNVDVGQQAHDMYSEHVSGFYDHHDHTLYLLEDQPATVQGLIIAHELAHALQDEKLTLDRVIREQLDSEDGQLALSAALEGNAQAVAAEVMVSQIGDEQLGGEVLRELMTEGTADSAAYAAQDSKAAPWLGLQLSFPYAAGARLIKALRTDADPGSTRVLSRLPASTAQVMDPNLYKANQKPLQGQIGLARVLSGATPVYATTLGRANIELLGEGVGEGWRGDRAEAVRVDGTACAAWVVAFESANQASRFMAAVGERLHAQAVGDAIRVDEKDHTVTRVSRANDKVVFLSHVPGDKVEAVEKAATAALH